MKRKIMILLTLAVTCGLIAGHMSSRPLAQHGNGAQEQETVLVLAARKDITTGSTINDPKDFFVEKSAIKGEEPKDAVTKLDDLKGRVVRRSLREGNIVCSSDLLTDHGYIGPYGVFPKGYRALGIRVHPECLSPGSILPRSRVDIIVKVRSGDDKTDYSQVLVQNALVLAVDGESLHGESAGVIPVVTVALTPEDILKVAQAKEYGPLNMVVRSSP
jgi:Flp pilus assembly protein CpaB